MAVERSRSRARWWAWCAIGASAWAWSCAAGDQSTSGGDDPDGGTAVAADGQSDAGDASASGDVGPSSGDDSSPPPVQGDDAPGDDASRGDDAAGSDAGGDDGSVADGSSDDASDAGTVDAGIDAEPIDAGTDASALDAGHDAGSPDAGHDAGAPDAGFDAGHDTGAPDAGFDAGEDAGCSAAALVINEVQTSGAGGAEDEWVELFNPNGCPVDISGWKLKHTSINGTSIATVFTVPGSTSLGPLGYGVIAGVSYTASAPTIGSFSTGVLADAGGGLGLYDASDTLVNSMGYGSGATNPFVETSAAPAGITSESIARIPNGVETKDNAVDFRIATTPTPGAKN